MEERERTDNPCRQEDGRDRSEIQTLVEARDYTSQDGNHPVKKGRFRRHTRKRENHQHKCIDIQNDYAQANIFLFIQFVNTLVDYGFVTVKNLIQHEKSAKLLL